MTAVDNKARAEFARIALRAYYEATNFKKATADTFKENVELLDEVVGDLLADLRHLVHAEMTDSIDADQLLNEANDRAALRYVEEVCGTCGGDREDGEGFEDECGSCADKTEEKRLADEKRNEAKEQFFDALSELRAEEKVIAKPQEKKQRKGHGYKTAVHAAKAVGKARGVKGNAGWLYTAKGKTICLGWATYADMLRKKSVIVKRADGKWGIV